MITSKLTTKAQTTIPQPVRAALRLKEGDELAYEIEENRVILTKASAGADNLAVAPPAVTAVKTTCTVQLFCPLTLLSVAVQVLALQAKLLAYCPVI